MCNTALGGWGGDACNAPLSVQGSTCPFVKGIAAMPMADLENHVFFPAGGYNLDADARKQLMQLTQVLGHPVMQGTCLRLTGHADSSDGASANLSLSAMRAQTVANFTLQKMAIQPPILL